MKNVIIDDSTFEILPELSVGVLILKDVKENLKISEKESIEIENILKNANKEAKKYLTSDVISENDVVKVWREAYSKFPTKKGARCSVENLLKRVLHDNPVGNIFPSVDITNAISLKYALPIGVEDADKIEGDLHLGVMKGGEHFLPIGSKEEEPPLAGEVAYYDDYGVVCRCLNWRDGIRTEVNDNTTFEFIAMECVDPNRVSELKKAIDELEMFMKKYMGANTIYKEILDKTNKIVNLS